MRRTIHAIAMGVAMMCCSLLSWSRVRASTVEIGDGLDDEPPAPLIDQQAGSEFAPPTGQTPAFTWSADSSLIPPPYVAAATDDHLVPLGTTSTAIPLPPAAWTGFTGLGALGTISLLRRHRLRR